MSIDSELLNYLIARQVEEQSRAVSYDPDTDNQAVTSAQQTLRGLFF